MIIDLTHPITEDMPVFPGAEQPELRTIAVVDQDGYFEKRLAFSSHTGTHMDAPAHMIHKGKTLDQFDISHFHGSALVVDVSGEGERPDAPIGTDRLAPFERQITVCDFVLLYTGWSRHWKTPDYFDHFPALTPEAAEWLTRFRLKGIGLDTLSADRMDSRNFPVHHILLGNGMVIVENLNALDLLPRDIVTLSCFPMPLSHADGSPVRAVAFTGASVPNRHP